MQRWEIYAKSLANHRLAISSEYSFLNLEPVIFHVGFWFDDVNSAQETTMDGFAKKSWVIVILRS